MPRDRHMNFGCILENYGSHPAAWLVSESSADSATDPNHYVGLAKLAESAKLDFVFVADTPCLPEGDIESLSRSPRYINGLEPLTLLAVLSAHTSHIGLVGTLSSSYNEPFNVARAVASLDHLSGGRAAWNVVTTGSLNAPANFGRDANLDHAVRYERAREFVEVVRGLWDTWGDGAIIRNVGESRYFDPRKLRPLNHKGKHFSVAGPLNIARPPQGHPVVVQAGGSDPGRELAAETADMVFMVESSLEGARSYYSDLKGRMKKFGRRPDELRLMQGITIVVGNTIAEAEAKTAVLSSRIHEDVGKTVIGTAIGVDLSGMDFDARIPPDLIPAESNRGQTYHRVISRMAIEEKLTIRQMSARFAESRIGNTLKGTPETIVDTLEAWYRADAVDGFMLRAMAFPDSLRDFSELVVPELQRRGLMRQDYAGKTLRSHLGLARPGN
ncbi:Nitrilotriacetate monooxygenase component A [Hyphomicrobiales bacterium]|nr:Nitrilotriacetate monooxygenase component A [Hyphomicrobiales bacterium]CAH1690085.1 Nitrilotriacetate monooxygenase component A [Hyphomicrobiales bacterium]